MSVIFLRGQIVHYEVLGRGRPLVFLHDWVGSWRYWIPSMQAASVSFRAYALDFWGFGDTSRNERYYSVEGQLSLLEELLEELGIARAGLVGHGLGAIIGLLFAQRKPEAVDRVMAIGLPHLDAALHPRLRSASPIELAGWLLERNSHSRNPATEPAWTDSRKTDPKAISFTIDSLQNLSLSDLPAQATRPCLMVYGGSDPALQPPDLERLLALPQGTHGITLDGCGHFPMLDQPAKFNRLMADFLDLPAGESPRQLQLKEEWKRRVR